MHLAHLSSPTETLYYSDFRVWNVDSSLRTRRAHIVHNVCTQCRAYWSYCSGEWGHHRPDRHLRGRFKAQLGRRFKSDMRTRVRSESSFRELVTNSHQGPVFNELCSYVNAPVLVTVYYYKCFTLYPHSRISDNKLEIFINRKPAAEEVTEKSESPAALLALQPFINQLNVSWRVTSDHRESGGFLFVCFPVTRTHSCIVFFKPSTANFDLLQTEAEAWPKFSDIWAERKDGILL